jgi:hypothetical protein
MLIVTTRRRSGGEMLAAAIAPVMSLAAPMDPAAVKKWR